ncbi:MAG TPA: hypothetical protein VK952_04095 [Methylotenera sp.]|nr:hypothetical protein [Methylotenera sp.]
MQQQDTKLGTEPDHILSLKELATLLVKNFGLTEGLFDLSIEFQIGVGGVGPDPATLIPGATIGVSKIGLQSTNEKRADTVDAAEVNPKKPIRKKTK